MAVNLKAFEAFLKKFQEGGEYYPNAKDGMSKQDIALLNRFAKEFSKIQNSESPTDAINFEQLIKEQDIVRNYLDSMKGNFADEKHYHEVRMPIVRSQKNVLINQIRLHVKHQHLTPKQIEMIQKQIKLLSKIQQVRRREEISEKKGASVAEFMLQSTLGISTVYNGPGGKKIIGIVKGMAKQLKKSVTVTNIISTILLNAKEHFMMADKAAYHAFQSAGFENYTKDLQETSEQLTTAAVVNPFGKIANMDIEIKNGVRSFHRMQFGTLAQRQMTAMAVELQQLGAESQDIVSLMSTMSGVFHDDAKDMVQAMDVMYGIAEETRRGVKQTAKDMAAAMPVYVKYGRAAGMDMFRRMSMVAAKANVDIKDLMDLTERFDNSEDALEQAARFNALLGGSFLNGLELLKAAPDEKVRLIADAYNRAEATMGVTSANVQRQIAENMNQSIGDFKAMVRGDFKDFEKEMSEKLDIPSIEKKMEDLISSKDAGEEMMARMTQIGLKVTNALLQNDMILGTIKSLLREPEETIKKIVIVLGTIKAFSLASSIIGSPLRPMNIIDLMPGPRGGRRGGGRRGGGTKPRVGGGYRGSRYSTKPPKPPSPPSIGSRLIGGLKAVGNSIGNFFRSGATKARSIGSTVVGGLKSMGSSALSTIGSGFRSLGGFLSTGLSKIGLGGAVKYIKGKGQALFNFLTSLSPKQLLKRLGDKFMKSGIAKIGGTVIRAIGYILGPLLTAIFTDFAIMELIKSGMSGKELEKAVGEVTINNLAGLLVGSALAAAVQGINVAIPGAGIILGAGAYLLGDLLGQKLLGPALQFIAPGLAPWLGSKIVKIPRYQNKLKQARKKHGITEDLIVKGPVSKRSLMVRRKIAELRKSGAVKFNDTPTVVSTAPMKKREFENSKKDGLLLETIYNMKSRMEQVSRVESKVVLKVEGRVLGVATLNG